MIDNATLKVIDIITDTKISKIRWTRIDYLKKRLESIDSNLSYFPNMHSYMKYLQLERFIFECKNSYVTFSKNQMIIIAKSKYSYEIRLDVLDTANPKSEWKRIRVSASLLLRLRNIILFTDNNSDNSEALLHSSSFFHNPA